jgi:hypothetical protein
MFRIMKRHWLYSAIICLLSLSIMTVSGCDNQYKRYNFKEGFCHFSFKYPSQYEWMSTNITMTLGYYSDISFRATISRESKVPSWLFISLQASTKNLVDYKAALESHIKYYEKILPDFRILSQDPILVNTGKGIKIVYSYYFPILNEDGRKDGEKGPPMIKIGAFFSYGDYIWEITLSELESNAEKAEVDFAQILNTLKIID